MKINSSLVLFSAPHIPQIRIRTAVTGIPSLYAVWPDLNISNTTDLLYRQAQEDRNHLLKIIAHHLRRETQQRNTHIHLKVNSTLMCELYNLFK